MGGWKLTASGLPPAPKGILEFVQCGCGVSRYSCDTCSCRRHSLSCTEMCKCDADADKCDNFLNPLDTDDVTYLKTAEEV